MYAWKSRISINANLFKRKENNTRCVYRGVECRFVSSNLFSSVEIENLVRIEQIFPTFEFSPACGRSSVAKIHIPTKQSEAIHPSIQPHPPTPIQPQASTPTHSSTHTHTYPQPTHTHTPSHPHTPPTPTTPNPHPYANQVEKFRKFDNSKVRINHK
jgi:hypothetical protein